MPEKSSIFDMIGPVMIGPSSSHTAGVVRIGLVAHKLLGDKVMSAEITFYNSFAATYEGHGSDRAVLAGLLGYLPDDIRIRDAHNFATQNGMEWSFKAVANASTQHPNTVRIVAHSHKRTVEIVGESRGAGLIKIVSIDGFGSDISASLHTLIVKTQDTKGAIAFVADVLAHDECNIATMSVSRNGRHQTACQFIESDTAPRPLTLEYLRSLAWVKDLIYMEAVS